MNSPLSNWPRYPGGALAGVLIGVASVLLFFFGVPPRGVVAVAVLAGFLIWVLRPRAED